MPSAQRVDLGVSCSPGLEHCWAHDEHARAKKCIAMNEPSSNEPIVIHYLRRVKPDFPTSLRTTSYSYHYSTLTAPRYRTNFTTCLGKAN